MNYLDVNQTKNVQPLYAEGHKMLIKKKKENLWDGGLGKELLDLTPTTLSINFSIEGKMGKLNFSSKLKTGKVTFIPCVEG